MPDSHPSNNGDDALHWHQDRALNVRGTSARHFIFCTGIENSSPAIKGPDGSNERRDGMQLGDHYRRWREDFQLVKDLGITFLRYGPPYYIAHKGPLKYDW